MIKTDMTSIEYINGVCRTESVNFDEISDKLKDRYVIRLLHGSLGLATEVGEFIDQLKKHIFYGKDLDGTNLDEELGDIFWYLGVICDELEMDFPELWEKNLVKLEKRYGNKFSNEKANERDLNTEREVLETPTAIVTGSTEKDNYRMGDDLV